MNSRGFSDLSGPPAESAAARRAGDTAPASQIAGFSLLLVVILTAIPYWRVSQFGFVYDDDQQVVANKAIRNWQSVPSYFSTSVGGLFDTDPSTNTYYRPLFVLFLRVNHALFSLEPAGWHVSSLLVHLLATALLFLLLRPDFHPPWIPAAGALLFGLHPIHIENVVWISGITDALAAVGMLGSLLLWRKARRSFRVSLRIGAPLLYLAALLAKETAIVFPAILLIYLLAETRSDSEEELGPRRRFLHSANELLPFVGVTLLYLLLRFLVLSGTPGRPAWILFPDVILTAPSLALFYLRQLIWPRGLSLFYDFPVNSGAALLPFWLPLVLLCGLGACGWSLWRMSRDPSVPAAMAWLAAPLLPVQNIAFLSRDDFVHDRYLYLPSVGLAIAAAILLRKLVQERASSGARVAGKTAVLLMLAGLGTSTAVQSVPWRDNLSLYTHAVARSPGNPLASNNLAAQYVALQRWDDAARVYEAILADRPDFWLANYNYGYLNYRLERYDRAERSLRNAAALNPLDADAHAYLGLTYFRTNRLPEAAAEFREAIAREPGGMGFHLGLGLVLLQQGNREGARAEFAEELRLHPESEAARSQAELLEAPQ
jgi:Flp pilus assembly protein TadD